MMNYEERQDYMLLLAERLAIANDYSLQKEERKLREEKRELRLAIEKTYDEVVAIYAEQESKQKELVVMPLGIRCSYSARAGGAINRRKNLQKRLKMLNERN